jgi:hypothetical protein
MTWVDRIADRLPNWKAHLNLAGRTALVNYVLSAIPVYLLIAMNIPEASFGRLGSREDHGPFPGPKNHRPNYPRA